MKILVTGGAGFIGSNFIRYLIKKYPDYKIINLDKLSYAGNLDNLKDIEMNPNYEFIKGDITNTKIADDLAKRNEVIINFAAETHVDRSIISPESFIETDVLGTYNLIETAKKNKVKKLIHISTDEVYGSIDSGSFNEQSPLKPNSPYSASKASADLLIKSYIKTYSFPAIIVRPSNNFGPYQYPEKLIPLFITNALENQPLPVYGDGKQVRDWLYVMDNCKAIDIVLHKGKSGETYNVGGGCEKKNIEITKEILKIVGKPESLIKYVTDRPGHDRRYSLDCKKISKELGWKPQHEFSWTLKDTVDWYIKNHSWWDKIKKKSEEFKKYYSTQYKDR